MVSNNYEWMVTTAVSSVAQFCLLVPIEKRETVICTFRFDERIILFTIRLRPSPFFSPFSVAWPTQIFAFSKKKNKLRRRHWRQWHIISNNCHFNLKHKQFFALQIFSFFLFSFEFNNDVDFFVPPLPRCWLCNHTLLFPGSTDIMLRYRAS